MKTLIYIILFLNLLFLTQCDSGSQSNSTLNNNSAETSDSIKYKESEPLFYCYYSFENELEKACIPEITPSFSETSLEPPRVINMIDSVTEKDNSYFISDMCLLYNCKTSTKNFAAVSVKDDNQDTIRFIVYSDKYYRELDASHTNWSVLGIFAHEIGHHYYHHTDKHVYTYRDSQERELQADKFSGYVLAKLGAKREQAEAGLNSVSHPTTAQQERYCKHPLLYKRIAALKEGYEFALQNNANVTNLVGSRTNEITYERRVNDTYKLFAANKFADAINQLSQLINTKSDPNLLRNRATVYMLTNKPSKAVEDLTAAIKVNKTDPDLFNDLRIANEMTESNRFDAQTLDTGSLGSQK